MLYVVIFLIILLFSPKIFEVFFSKTDLFHFKDPKFKSLLFKSSIWVSFYMLFEGFAWVMTGMLTAAGDTKFIMKIGVVAPWILGIIPVALSIKYFSLQIDGVWLFYLIYSLSLFIIYFLRYKSKKWKNINIKDMK